MGWAEFEEVMKDWSIKHPEHRKHYFNLADKDKNGKISFYEYYDTFFKTMMKKYYPGVFEKKGNDWTSIEELAEEQAEAAEKAEDNKKDEEDKEDKEEEKEEAKTDE